MTRISRNADHFTPVERVGYQTIQPDSCIQQGAREINFLVLNWQTQYIDHIIIIKR